MHNLLIPQSKVKPSTPPSTQPPSLPPDFLEHYQQWLLQKGLDQQQVHWWSVWVQRFRAFRRQEASPKPFPQALTAFVEYQRTQFSAEPWQIDHARKAILELASWWRTHQVTGGPASPHAPVTHRQLPIRVSDRRRQ